MTAGFIDGLAAAADGCAVAEKDYRREAAQRIKTLEQERAFAFRRLNFMRTVADIVLRAETEETAIAGGAAILRSRLGWEGDSEASLAALAQFAPVSQALFASLHPVEERCKSDAGTALAAFESWYAATHAASFWMLFEQPMMETPVVDF